MIPTFDSVDQNPGVNLLAVYNKRLLAGYLDYIIIVYAPHCYALQNRIRTTLPF